MNSLQTLGDYEMLDGLRAVNPPESGRRSQREVTKIVTYNSIVDQDRRVSEIKYPPQMLKEEVERVMHSLEHDLEDRKLDMPTYLKTLNKEEDDFY